MKKALHIAVLALCFVAGGAIVSGPTLLVAPSAYAALAPTGPGGGAGSGGGAGGSTVPNGGPDLSCNNGGVKVSTALKDVGDSSNCVGDSNQNPIFALIGRIIQIASGVFGLILVLMIVISGLEYVLAGGNSDKTKGARDRLESAATGLVLFILMFGILQVILPPDAKVFHP